MDKNKDIQLKKILQELPLDKAPVNFTNKVMHDVSMFTNEELLRDSNLTKLLKENVIEEPSIDFVSNIMSNVESKKEIVYEPIISKKTWFIIVAFFVGIIFYVFSTSRATESPSLMAKTTPYLERLQSLFSGFTFNFELSTTVVIGLLSMCSLLIIDFISREKTLI